MGRGRENPDPSAAPTGAADPQQKAQKMPIESFVIPFFIGFMPVFLIAILIVGDEDTAFLMIVTYVMIFFMTAIPLSS